MADLTVLLPCRTQREDFFRDAVRSMVAQTSSAWRLLVVVDENSPPALHEWAESFGDPRIEVIVSDGGFARAVNLGMRRATTEWVAILLSDDRWDRRAVEVLARHMRASPRTDVFHSARREIDADGNRRGGVQPSRPRVTARAFRTVGSPVKHLICWRRTTGLAVGGLDESLSEIGCDDYDFPWRLLEAGARFHAIPDCLYEYRVHHAGPRLTTDAPLRRQLDVLGAMFRKHAVPPAETAAFLQHAMDGYLVKELHFDFAEDWRSQVDVACYREVGPGRAVDFLARGYAARHFFPHRVYRLAKPGPDGLKLAWRMLGVRDPGRLAQLLLFARPPVLDELPPALAFDPDVQWHQQHHGRPGLVASADVVLGRDALTGTLYLSDLVQRMSRRREHKTRVEGRLKGWHRLLMNALMDLARDLGVREVRSPTAALAMAHTDAARRVQPALFERVYDTALREQLVVARDGPWWRLDVAANEDRIVPLDKDADVAPATRTICVCHDVERGRGHVRSDPAFSRAAETASVDALGAMLAVERKLGVRATYNVLGVLLEELRDAIERDGHALGFHSWDHADGAWRRRLGHAARRLAGRAPWDDEGAQLSRCRRADYRLKGYRPPQSRLTPGLSDRNLAFHNFEWLASSAASLGFRTPRLENGVVKLPILFDDYDLFRRRTPFAAWRRRALELVDAHPFVAFGLHDCYAEHWLPHYEEFLQEIRARGRLRTLDEVAADVALAHARWV